MEFVNVIVDISHEKLDRVFQYRVPPELEGRIQAGMQVNFPFGMGNRPMKGYVVGCTEEPDYPIDKIKTLTGIVPGSVPAESQLIALAAWMKETYGSTMNQALKTVLPVKQQIRQKQSRRIVLSMERTEAEALLAEFQRKHYRAKERVLDALLKNPEGALDYDRAFKELKATAAVLGGLQDSGVLRVESSTRYRNPLAGRFAKRAQGVTLNREQRLAADGIWEGCKGNGPRTYLLHGVTGSGKTEVYMELIGRVIREGKQAIVLIPEIALTFQTVGRFYERFGDRVSVMHSRLSDGERYDQFLRAKEGSIDVMIGPRSALFAPFLHLGIIIMDEEHESSYKSENVPRYHARETAIYRAKMCGAFVVLGSATPSTDSFYRARCGEYGYYRLPDRIGRAALPQVTVVDLREELRAGNRSIFSRKLREGIQERLEKRQQTMLFLNRRGLAGFVSCRSCGKAVRCPHCDVTLSLHGDGRLRCHYCGYEQEMPGNCPSCGSPYISGFRAGTQQIEREVYRAFPGARVLRMDYDTTRSKESYETILSAFADRQADILVGTQMIVKGHDFPGVTLVGVLAADLSLYASDYRASERTFQLLTQAVGRAGRRDLPGEAVIQTYVPEHYSIRMAARQDYEGFYEQEMLYRRLLGYPPVCGMLGIYLSGQDEHALERQAEYLGGCIRGLEVPGLSVIGPAKAALAKKKDIFRRVIYLKHQSEGTLLKVKGKLEKMTEQETVRQEIYIQYDWNPISVY